MGKYILKLLFFVIIFMFLAANAVAQESPPLKTKFYNFDDLLIEGKIKKPQVLWTDARQKVKFEKLLKLKKKFLHKILETKKDPVLK